MDFSLKTCNFESLQTDCFIVSFYADGSLSSGAQFIDTATGQISHWLNLKDGTIKTGTTTWVHAPEQSKLKRILLVCVGASAQASTAQDFRDATKAVCTEIFGKNIKNAIWSIDPTQADTDTISGKLTATLIADGFTYNHYQYTASKTKDVKIHSLRRLTLHSTEKFTNDWRAGLKQGSCAGLGKNTARQLGNLPANYCTPSFLADQALALADATMKVKVLDMKQIKKLGMGAFLSVAAGSDEPAKFIVMEYCGATSKTKPTVLVGKGITFDTGGISLKPGQGMDEMKFDMCGAASVMGVMTALSHLKPKINVVGVIAATENMPSGRATKPGDVVTSMSGQTIEILNTDAEGRLVLCDALTYIERFKPKHVIDIATLTGACVIALGSQASGLFANDQALASELLNAGEVAADKAWQLPIWDEYKKSLDSNFADMANIGGREAGSITAACFLSKFTQDYSWAHLDIAGTAWASGSSKGASGRPVGLLLQFLLGLYGDSAS